VIEEFNSTVEKFNKPKIAKQYEMLKRESPIIEHKLREYIQDKLVFARSFIIKPQLSFADFSMFSKVILAINMDMYAFPRIFRNLISTKHSKQFNSRSDHVLFYAGKIHAENLVEFITKYLKVKPETYFDSAFNMQPNHIIESGYILL